MSVTNFSNTYYSNADISIPANAFNVTLVVAGGSGGTGGGDSGGPGSGGGAGKRGTFVLPNYTARTLNLRPGGAGPNGPGCFGRGTVGGSGVIPGGRGGSASGCSGSGAGGGGASGVYDSLFGNWIIVAGGGGGGGGGAWEAPAISSGGNAGGWTGIGSVTGGADGAGAACGDGAGGGGGGGGNSGGGGGSGGCDFGDGGSGGDGGGSGYNSSAATITADNFNSGSGYISLSYTAVQPQINLFSATPNPQNSTSGTPQYSTLLSWSVVDTNSLTITSSTGQTYNVTGTSSLSITNLPQSNASGPSPATRSYTLTACFNSICVTSTITVQVRNDNTPSNSWTTSFSNLEPSTEYQYFIGKLSGVDMPTIITASGSGHFVGKTIGGSFASSVTFNDQDNVILKFTTLPFNTDLTGVTGIYGKTNSKTIPVTAGTQSFNVTVTTRAPRVSEDFNYADNKGQYPYADIDLIANAPTQYLTSANITLDDVELVSSDNAIEIKVDKPDAQIRINNGTWQNARQI